MLLTVVGSSIAYADEPIENQGTSLPVILITSDGFENMYNSTDKNISVTGNIKMYDGNGKMCFENACGMSLSGKASISMVRHKSLKIDFDTDYGGSGSINYDLFGTGESKYHSFILRAGTDAESRIFNEVIWQDLAMEMSDNNFTQHSRFAVVYVNDKYYGLYIIKENIGARYYSQWKGVSKSSVENYNPAKVGSQDYTNVFCSFIRSNDMSIDENYEKVCSMVDIDNLIDYLIIEGVSGNNDLYYNVRVFRSSESDNRWQYAIFDLDSSMAANYYFSAWNNLYSNMYASNSTMGIVMQSLIKNDEFRSKLIHRYAEVYHDYLGNDKLIEKIEYYENIVGDEVDRSFARWNASPEAWRNNIAELKSSIISLDYENLCVEQLKNLINMTDEEMALFSHEGEAGQ